MKNEKTLVIFGAPDHEEKLARRVAEAAGCTTATATYQGKPVHAGNAYKADGTIDFGSAGAWDRVIFFECGSEELIREFSHNGIGSAKCDHHRPGDPGYGEEDYWFGSSLGQLCAMLAGSRRKALALALYCTSLPESEILMTAAGDHCPAKAYAGKCEFINPHEFFEFRIRQKAEYLNSVNKVMGLGLIDYERMVRADIQEAMAKLLLNRKEDVEIIDLREYGQINELPEAAMKLGLSYMTKIAETDREGNPTGNDKILLGGCTTPEQVKEFMAWAVNLNNRVGEPYGNPTRGFAGVVVHNERLLCVCCGAEIACANINTCPECGTAYPDEV